MEKIYSAPEIEVTEIAVKDIIASSPGEELPDEDL